MKNRRYLNTILRTDRKSLYIILGIVMFSILTLTVVYSALSTTLNINGQAEVTAASWDIHLDNVLLNSRSITSNIPTITDSRSVSFSTTLTKPGDFYEFTVDIVNSGQIDAMIDSVTKTPELSNTQKKYLNYIVEYQNGEEITTKQLVEKESYVRLKVKVEFRNDISQLDLPTEEETLNLSFTVNYIQSDNSNDNVTIDKNGRAIKIISGDYDTVGSEICLAEECFYVMSSDTSSITMFAKYNLYVGGTKYKDKWVPYNNGGTGIQDSSMIGRPSNFNYPRYGITKFSTTSYWINKVSSYPAYVYDSNSSVYNYVENYKLYLESLGFSIEEARLIKYEEMLALGCDGTTKNCSAAPSWLKTTSYWTGSANGSSYLWYIYSGGLFNGYMSYSDEDNFGVRPVIKLNILN